MTKPLQTLLFLCAISSGTGFLPQQPPSPSQSRSAFHSSALKAIFADDNGDSSSSSRWSLEALRERAAELETAKHLQNQKWRNADCDSGVKVSLHDWVRRLDVQYPLAACGTSSGRIYLTHLETGEMLAQGTRPREQQQGAKDALPNTDKNLFHLYGEFDGGGQTAIAFGGNLIAEAQRDGGVHFWRLDAGSSRLVYQGHMKSMEGVLVTCLHLDDEFLWVGDANGKLQAFPLDSEYPLAMQTQPELEWQFRSMLCSLSLTPEISCGVVTTVEGTVELISLEDDGRSLCSFYPPYDDDDEKLSIHGLSAVLVAHEPDKDAGMVPYSIAVGGNDGSLMLQPLQMTEDGELDEYRPFLGSLRRFKPSHKGPVKCLANPVPGMLISASHDGSMRLWDVKEAHCLYQFVGYKVWLGSLWTDGKRIVSDGSDNTVIVHDFENQDDNMDHGFDFDINSDDDDDDDGDEEGIFQ